MTATEKLIKRIELLERFVSDTPAGRKVKQKVDLLKSLLPKKRTETEANIRAIFAKCKTVKEVKKTFYDLAKIYHPDNGGDQRTMQIINEVYRIYAKEISELEAEREADKRFWQKMHEEEKRKAEEAKPKPKTETEANLRAIFEKCKTAKDVKKTFYDLANIYHPDRGGDVRTMQTLNNLHDLYKKRFEREAEMSKKWATCMGFKPNGERCGKVIKFGEDFCCEAHKKSYYKRYSRR